MHVAQLPGLARERRAQAAAARGLEHRVAGAVGDGVLPAVEPDHDRVGNRAVGSAGGVLGNVVVVGQHRGSPVGGLGPMITSLSLIASVILHAGAGCAPDPLTAA